MYLKLRIDKFLEENPGDHLRLDVLKKLGIGKATLNRYIFKTNCKRILTISQKNDKKLISYLDTLKEPVTYSHIAKEFNKNFLRVCKRITHKNLIEPLEKEKVSYWELKDKETSIKVSKLKYKLDKIERKRFSHFSNNRISELYY